MIAIGTKVIWLTDRATKFNTGTVTKSGKSYGEKSVWLDDKHKSEDALLEAFLFVDTNEARQHLNNLMAQTAQHRAEEDAIQRKTYELLNQQVRDGLR